MNKKSKSKRITTRTKTKTKTKTIKTIGRRRTTTTRKNRVGGNGNKRKHDETQTDEQEQEQQQMFSPMSAPPKYRLKYKSDKELNKKFGNLTKELFVETIADEDDNEDDNEDDMYVPDWDALTQQKQTHPVVMNKNKNNDDDDDDDDDDDATVVDAKEEEEEEEEKEKKKKTKMLRLEEEERKRKNQNKQKEDKYNYYGDIIKNTICDKNSSGHECMLFGSPNSQKYKMVKTHFKSFLDFSLINKEKIRRVSGGSNGFVYETPFEKGNMTTTTILKISSTGIGDNLFYEAFVGMYYINFQCLYYPLFLETYSTFKISPEMHQNFIADPKDFDTSKIIIVPGKTLHHVITPSEYHKNINRNDDKFKEFITNSCINPQLNACLMQYIPNAITLQKHLAANISSKNVEHSTKYILDTLFVILFQIYSVLSYIRKEFTHYDLHIQNVLIYELPKGETIELIYYNDDNYRKLKCHIHTNIIVKLIDYGRCHTPKSKKYIDLVCKIPECKGFDDQMKNTCGSESGYLMIAKKKNYTFMLPSLKNESADIRLIRGIYSHNIKPFINKIHPEAKEIITKSRIYNMFNHYGSEEMCQTAFGTCENENGSVKTIYEELLWIYIEKYYTGEQTKTNPTYRSNIYLDREHQYTFEKL